MSDIIIQYEESLASTKVILFSSSSEISIKKLKASTIIQMWLSAWEKESELLLHYAPFFSLWERQFAAQETCRFFSLRNLPVPRGTGLKTHRFWYHRRRSSDPGSSYSYQTDSESPNFIYSQTETKETKETKESFLLFLCRIEATYFYHAVIVLSWTLFIELKLFKNKNRWFWAPELMFIS